MAPNINLKHMTDDQLESALIEGTKTDQRNFRSAAIMGFCGFIAGMCGALIPIFTPVEFPMQITLIVCSLIFVIAAFIGVKKARDWAVLELEPVAFEILRRHHERFQ